MRNSSAFKLVARVVAALLGCAVGSSGGDITVEFREGVTEDAAGRMLRSHGMTWQSDFPERVLLWVKVLRGVPQDYVPPLEDNAIVEWADNRENPDGYPATNRYLLVMFRPDATTNDACELIRATDGLETCTVGVPLGTGAVHAPDGKEHDWVEVLKKEPIVSSVEFLPPDSRREPLDSNVILGIREWRPEGRPAAANSANSQLRLMIQSEKEFPHCNIKIVSALKEDRGALGLEIAGIDVPDFGVHTVGPASGHQLLAVTNGTYVLRVHHRGQSDEYTVSIAADAVRVNPVRATVSRFSDSVVWRFPSNSPALH